MRLTVLEYASGVEKRLAAQSFSARQDITWGGQSFDGSQDNRQDGLNIGDIDLRTGTLRIRLKDGTEGRVFLNPGLRRMMCQYLKVNAPQGTCGPDRPLFRASTGNRLGARQIQLRFASLFRETGIDRQVSIHSLRHTFATRLYERTGDLHLVQRALGHRQITTTEVYAKVSDGALRRAISMV